jgi:hypothetical protein
MTEQEKILDKVRKLLALSSSTPYPAEAETAMALAQKLLLDHDLSMAEAGDAADQEFEEHVIATGGPDDKLSAETSFVWAIVEEFFFCSPLRVVSYDHAKFVLIGRREHLPMGRHVGIYLSRTFRACWTTYRRERRAKRSDERTYYAGVALGISARLIEEREMMTRHNASLGALVRSHDAALAAEVRRLHPGVVTRERELRGSDTSFLDGFERGKKISIRTPLGPPRAQPRLGQEAS